MRAVFALLALLPAGGCAVPIFGRTLPDMLYSATLNQDCSIVYLDAGAPYCRERAPPTLPPKICTRSLGVPDCWVNPQDLLGSVKPIADDPFKPTAAQIRAAASWWP